MSIASEITRLQTAKADIKAAIEDKGVTVPSAAMLDEFSDYIDEISGGGGGSGAVSGTFTPASDLRSITLPDTIGKSSILIYPMFDLVYSEITLRVHWGELVSNGRCILAGSTNSGKNSYAYTFTNNAATGQLSSITFDSTTGTVTIGYGADNNYGGYYISGKQYGYFAC